MPGNYYKSINYAVFNMSAIQEQQHLIEQQEIRLKKLEADLISRIEKLEKIYMADH